MHRGVYVVKYDNYRRKYVYSHKDFYPEKELDANVYARDHIEYS